ncbi:MAG: LuxR C-terminal-related transcriptional regulator [Gammaproteobacteria bacterium]|nr:LuxR C-terminal-related transcriptional regulator [Gammaproteobacteria bacterium]
MISIYIIWQEIADSYYKVDTLKQTLKKEIQDKKTYSQQVQILRVGLLEVLNGQFERWSLSKSEQEVALLLIKGLSFEQINQIRGTKEKTVRQQASTIYQKSNLDGRSHLAAYFLEDLF